jgi:hypothetical protein
VTPTENRLGADKDLVDSSACVSKEGNMGIEETLRVERGGDGEGGKKGEAPRLGIGTGGPVSPPPATDWVHKTSSNGLVEVEPRE